jgi:hypothetical protein
MFGEGLDFEIRVTNAGERAQSLMIDYAIHHVKSDGSLSPKVFKCKAILLAPGHSHTIERRHAMRPITTRRYYPGQHRITILVNGAESASESFILKMPSPKPT